ncbi:hypothetical protein JCM19294_1991 [Nonlabens tegetincola]|uniref:Uncharacterized protein n=1 Tax=Nonlabens tegetincola TaxID=323273 RepID=A0A090Q446_9FLAO|nr:exostosin family protein [Nonlabens tegetincola]PQJ14073.1 hypothetical protein BST93_12535 [Nonlabens tegetincola]GAK96478.1 hypothetical protein JCM19294_1991 [Nonlabens tegetincola]
MISVFTDVEILSTKNRGKVHPLLFDLHYFEHTHPIVHKYYQLVNTIEKADIIVFPIDYLRINTKEEQQSWKFLNHLAISNGKKLHVYTGGDYGKTFSKDYIVTWRNSGYRNTNQKDTIIIPSFIADPIGIHVRQLKWIAKKEKPEISFTGFATHSRKERFRYNLSYLKNLMTSFRSLNSDRPIFFNAAKQRFLKLKALERDQQIATRFIYRDRYRAGATSEQERQQTTQEFFDNLNNSPYAFCMRGAGNFSVRFYEALALGRIPVLIETNNVLPLENEINWSNHVCVIKKDESIINKLVQFHDSCSEERFIELQQNNRKLFENYLVRHNFFYHVKNQIDV